MAEEVLTIGAVLGDRYKKYMGEEPPEWFRTAEDALGRTYYWAKDCAERHEQLHKLFSFVFLLSSTSRKIFLGLLASVWAVFSFLLGSVWVALSFIVGSLWGGISYVVMSLWAVLAFLVGSILVVIVSVVGYIWAAFCFLVGSIWVALCFVVGSIWVALCFVVGSIWVALCFIVGSIWVALCFVVGSIWVALCFIAALVWAALPFLVVSGFVVYGGFLIWGKYQTRLQLFLTTLKTNPNPKGPLIRIDVTHGNSCYEIIVPAYSTFGDVKKRFAKWTGLEIGNRRLLFRGEEKKDEVHLHQAGVIDESSVLII